MIKTILTNVLKWTAVLILLLFFVFACFVGFKLMQYEIAIDESNDMVYQEILKRKK